MFLKVVTRDGDRTFNQRFSVNNCTFDVVGGCHILHHNSEIGGAVGISNLVTGKYSDQRPGCPGRIEGRKNTDLNSLL